MGPTRRPVWHGLPIPISTKRGRIVWGGGEGHSHFFKVLTNLRLLGVVLLSLTNDLQISINNSLSQIKLETLSPKNWNYFGKVLKCQTPSGRASLTLYKPSHKIRHCQGTYCVHFSLFYTNVQILYTICTLLKLYINVHWVSSGKKY